MNKAGIIFPHQLFEKVPFLNLCSQLFLIEEPLFFTQFKFHTQKLIFHRASMKFYEDLLRSQNFNVEYIEFTEKHSDVRQLLTFLKKKNISEIHYTEVTDNWLEKRIRHTAANSGLKLVEHDSPLFMNSRNELRKFFSGQKKFRQIDFYIWQRKKWNILVNEEKKPAGGRWSLDSENRRKYPLSKKPPEVKFEKESKYYPEAEEYIERNLRSNYGVIKKGYNFPVTHKGARDWLNDFLVKRFYDFGLYQDAIVKDEIFMHHSILSPMLNIGLLMPDELLSTVIRFSSENNVPDNSLEGFIRQILGWREFVRAVYEIKGSDERSRNFWRFRRRIPSTFWTATTGIEPVDATIKKVLNSGYCHHIERLMVLGNFMLLCEFDPNDVYRWFMEMFIDGYDWVMVPNVYGMSQYADGGLMASKPYISSSNYIKRMSDYGNGPWQQIWDSLFWRFVSFHRDFFSQNPRLSMLVRNLERMSENKLRCYLEVAEEFLKKLDLD